MIRWRGVLLRVRDGQKARPSDYDLDHPAMVLAVGWELSAAVAVVPSASR